jgi:hypothetical protein
MMKSARIKIDKKKRNVRKFSSSVAPVLRPKVQVEINDHPFPFRSKLQVEIEVH